MTTNASPGADAPSAISERPTRGRDTREGAHDDDSAGTTNNHPPNHGRVTNYPPAVFLRHVGQGRAPCSADTPVDELGDYYDEWRRRQGYDSEQEQLDGWSE